MSTGVFLIAVKIKIKLGHEVMVCIKFQRFYRKKIVNINGSVLMSDVKLDVEIFYTITVMILYMGAYWKIMQGITFQG